MLCCTYDNDDNVVSVLKPNHLIRAAFKVLIVNTNRIDIGQLVVNRGRTQDNIDVGNRYNKPEHFSQTPNQILNFGFLVS